MNRQLKQLDDRHDRLLNTIEHGTIQLAEKTHSRVQDIKLSKEALNIQIANASIDKPNEIPTLTSSQLNKLSKILEEKLLSDEYKVSKGYLQLMVNEVVMTDDQFKITGRVKSIIGQAVMAKENNAGIFAMKSVPSSVGIWGG